VLVSAPLIDWTLRLDPDGPAPAPAQAELLAGRVLDVRVPGAVHGDLLDAGLIPDPLFDDQEVQVAWVSRADWVYESTGPAPQGHERVDLVFDGLDTVAVVEVDGIVVGRSRIMHRSYRYDVTSLLTGAAHRVAVHLSSAYTEAEAERERLGPRPNAYPEPFNYLRKMACSFGWDWGPTVVGAAIWRPARWEAWSTARIARLRPLVDVVGGTGTLRVLLDVERTTGGAAADLDVEVLLDGVPVGRGALPAGANSAEIRVDVPDVRVWRPVGYGRPELYDLQVRLTAGDDPLDVARRRIGFRSLELDRTADDIGSSFVFRINDEPVLVKGVNWIPDDVLPGRMTRQRYAQRLAEAVAANVNLIRVWGGGIYESDDFYDVCDELGLLVWQDFLFACAAYPEAEPLISEIDAEARENVARLSAHPSLVLWNGNNENLWLHEVEHWADREGGRLPWGQRYYLLDLPAIVAEVDPSRPYTAGSPWSGGWQFEPNDPNHQTMHSWDVWNREDYLRYRDTAPRFVAEFGWQAPPAWTTLRDAVSDNPITPSSPGVLHHQKAQDGNGKLERGLAHHFPVPTDVDAWHYLTQLNQVRAIETGVLHWRSHWPRTAGTILWQLNDLWPVTSWAAIDGAGRYKPLFYALRDLYADRVLTIQPSGERLDLCVLNDSPEPWSEEIVVMRIDEHGTPAAIDSFLVETEPRSVHRIPLPAVLTTFDDPAAEVLVAAAGSTRSLWYGAEPKDTRFTGADPIVDVEQTDEGLEITLTATTLLRDVLVQADRIHPDAIADTGFVTLLPGQSGTIAVRCPVPLDPGAVEAPYALTWLDLVLDEVGGA
jgi:beta-mannosidase